MDIDRKSRPMDGPYHVKNYCVVKVVHHVHVVVCKCPKFANISANCSRIITVKRARIILV